MKKTTIIVPVYNSYSVIDKCINSIINQTYKNIELLLINDGSSDQSLDKLKQFEKSYNFIRFIDKKNEGVAKTRNLGIKEATGEYIMFIDNDDYIDEDYVERFVNEIEKSKSDVVCGGYRRENSEGRIIKKRSLHNTSWSKYIVMAPWAKIYRKEFIENNRIEFLTYPIGEDVYFIMQLIAKKAKFHIFSYIGYTWYFNEESVSNTKQKGLKEDINIFGLLEKIVKLFPEKGKYDRYFIHKYCIWYLLFSGRNSSKQKFILNYKEMKEWLIKNDCSKTISSFSKQLKGESLKDRIPVFIFRLLGKCNLMGLFAKFYCKGSE